MGDGLRDPLDILGPDIFNRILQILLPRHLIKAALVSTNWRVAASDDGLWKRKCKEVWNDEVLSPAGLSWKRRWLMAEAERKRTRITQEELCAFTWRFRFKRTAGTWWMQYDPYWTTKDPNDRLKRFFSPDFTVVGPKDDRMWHNEVMAWSFLEGSNGNPNERMVRINDYPPLKISRTKEWGWQMDNVWVVMEADLVRDGPYQKGVGGVKPHLA